MPIFQIPDHPRIGVFGQAPGNLAHQKRKPYCDPSGVRLRQWMGVDETVFYDSGKVAIVPMAFCFPGYDGTGSTGRGGDRPPPKICAGLWRERIIRPILPKLRVILLVGSYAQRWHLDLKARRSQSEVVGQWQVRFAAYEASGQLMLAMPHPSWRNSGWLKKNLWFEHEVVPRLQAAVQAALIEP